MILRWHRSLRYTLMSRVMLQCCGNGNVNCVYFISRARNSYNYIDVPTQANSGLEEYLELEGNTQNLSKVKISDHEASLILTAFQGRTSSNTFSMRDMLGVLNALKRKLLIFLSLVEAQSSVITVTKGYFYLSQKKIN